MLVSKENIFIHLNISLYIIATYRKKNKGDLLSVLFPQLGKKNLSLVETTPVYLLKVFITGK